MKYKVYVNEEELTDYAIIPMSEQLALDESLDQAFVQLKFTDKQNAYRPFTTVVVNVTDEFNNTRELSYFVASDNKTEIIGTDTFSHDLLCIEQSKWLERFLTGTKTVTNPLVHDYISAVGDVYISEHAYGGAINEYNYGYTSQYKSIYLVNEELECVSSREWNFLYSTEHPYSATITGQYVDITFPNNNTIRYQVDDAPVLTLENGQYSFDYLGEVAGGLVVHDTFSISVISQLEPKPNKTITDAVNDLLATVETLRENETPRFSFNRTQATIYSNIDSPEFTLTGTLWEALRQIGTYIHSIPRLKNNVIYFDELGGDERVATKLTDYVSNTEKFDIEQYATAIDSTIQNVVNLDDLEEGSIVEPYKMGYKTPRTETGSVQIKSDNVFIQTKEPIEKIIKVEVGYLTDDSIVGDITPYVYEQAEYDALSSYEDNYPYAKAYAIKYTIGQKNITGLTFKIDNALSSSVFSNFAIKNIISRATNKPITIINQLFGDNIGDISKLQFRVTYIPITTTRVKQVKPYTEDLEFDSTLAYNQSAQKISSRAYGEAMKGAIARLGNPQITKVFILRDLSLIPKVGQLYDDEYYVSVVKCEYYNDFVKCSLGLSKDFNKLNEYVGINSEERFYEISEKQAEDRYVPPYEDYCVISSSFEDIDYEKPETYTSLLTEAGIDTFKKLYSQTNIEAVNVIGYDSQNIEQTGVILPVISYGIGNSSMFTFKFDDNYSAGDRVFQEHSSVLQSQVRYTDEHGEIEKIKLYFMSTTQNNSNNYNLSVAEGNNLPLNTAFDGDYEVLAKTENDKIVLKKDNRERIIFTYQIHYVCNDKDIVIGSLPYRNGLIDKNNHTYYYNPIFSLYALSYKIPRHAKFIDPLRATHLSSDDFTLEDYVLRSIDNELETVKIGFTIYKKAGVEINCVSWAIALPDGEIVIGGNKGLSGQTIKTKLVSFRFARKIK